MTPKLVRNNEDPETRLHFSYSQLNTYLICPMKYAHNYVWGTPWESRPVALCFGKAIHKAAENYYDHIQLQKGIMPVEEMIFIFESVFEFEINKTDIELSFKNGETSESVREQGLELIKLFHAEASPQTIMAVEFDFAVTVPDIINGNGNLPVHLVGVMDLVEADADRTYLVVELKTSAQRFSSLRLEYDLQATIYSYAMSRMNLSTSENSCLIRYDVLLKTKKPAFERYYVTRTESDHQRLIHLINHVLKAIEHKIFYRNTGWQCGDCKFKRACFKDARKC